MTRDGETPELSSLPSRIVKTFVSPGELFEELREDPVWLGALLVVVAGGIVSSLLIPEELMREAMLSQAGARGEGVPPEQVDRMVTFGTWFARIGSVVGPFILAGVIAGFMSFTFNLVMGGRVSFRQLFSASSHALLIPTFGGLVTLPLILASGDLNTALALHLLVPGLEEGSYAYHLFRGLNVFSLATAGVLGVAVDRMDPKRKAGTAAAVMVGTYVALKAVLALFGGTTPAA
jgi:hypothetical protein